MAKRKKKIGVLCEKRSDDRNARTLEVQIERTRKRVMLAVVVGHRRCVKRVS